MNAAGLAALLSSSDPAQLRQGLELARSLGEACPVAPLFVAMAEAMLEASGPLGEGPRASEVDALVRRFLLDQALDTLPEGWAYRLSDIQNPSAPRPHVDVRRLDGERDQVLMLPWGGQARLRPLATPIAVSGSAIGMIDGIRIDLSSFLPPLR